MSFDPKQVRAKIDARKVAIDSCPGHEFVINTDPNRRLDHRWVCLHCKQAMDNHYVSGYMAGLRDGIQGHVLVWGQDSARKPK